MAMKEENEYVVIPLKRKNAKERNVTKSNIIHKSIQRRKDKRKKKKKKKKQKHSLISFQNQSCSGFPAMILQLKKT